MITERKINRDYIVKQISAIKKNVRSPINYSNFYFHQFTGDAEIAIHDDCSVVFILADRDIYRLYFFSKDLNKLERIFKAIDIRPTVIDYICSDLPQGLENVFLRSGFMRYGKMIHMSNNKLAQYEQDEAIEYANETDENEVNDKLVLWLDKYTGHFPDRNELILLINNKQVLVEKKDGRIIGLFIYKIQGTKGNLFQWGFSKDSGDYNPDLALRLYNNVLYLLHEKGAKKVDLWVNEKNITVIKIHTFNGFCQDNLFDYIYLKR